MEDDGRKKVEKVREKTLFLKVAGDHLGTFGGVPIAQKKLYPTEVTTFFPKFGNRTVCLPIDSH